MDPKSSLANQPSQPASLPGRKGELHKRTLAQGSKVESISRRHLDVLASACACQWFTHSHTYEHIQDTYKIHTRKGLLYS